MDFSKLLANPKRLAGLVAVGVVVLFIVVQLASLPGIQKTMVQKEQTLSSTYLNAQNVLDSYVKKVTEMLGVAESATEAQRTVIEDAVKGRYEGDTGANPTGGAYFSAITEAYPDLAANQELYGKVQDAVSAGREEFKNYQTFLIDNVRDYQTWKNSGILHPMKAKMMGAPSENLEACIGDDCVTGANALARMKRIILSSGTKDAYNTGEQESLDLGPKTNE